jgi:hypothetical protein
MKHSVKVMTICLALVCSIFFFNSNAMGRSSFEHGSGEPPYGLAIQRDAQGAKLYGELFLEHYDYLTRDNVKSAQILRVVVRLRKGDTFDSYFAKLDCTDLILRTACSALGTYYDTTMDDIIKQAIIGKMKDAVLTDFFGDTTLTIRLKNIEEFGQVFNDPVISPDVRSAFSLSDIELAVK